MGIVLAPRSPSTQPVEARPVGSMQTSYMGGKQNTQPHDTLLYVSHVLGVRWVPEEMGPETSENASEETGQELRATRAGSGRDGEWHEGLRH